MNHSFLAKAGAVVRYILVAGIAVMIGLIVTSPQYPQIISRAQADGISAAPGMLMTTLGAAVGERLYLVDTNKQVICTYSASGDQLRLVSARKYDYDLTIPDASIGKPIRIEGGNGITRDEAKTAGEAIKAMIDAVKGKK